MGCLFDAWSRNSSDNDKWMRAFENTGIDIGFQTTSGNAGNWMKCFRGTSSISG